MERINKVIAASGIASRREADRFILEGKVSVNGQVVRELGIKIDPMTDKIVVNGRPLPQAAQTITYLFNKPRHVICSTSKQGKAKIITEFFPAFPPVFPVGRLDKESEGLILVTNNGELAHRLTHPSFNHQKTYLAICRPEKGSPLPEPATIKQRLEKGVKLGDGDAKADSVRVEQRGEEIFLTISVHEGRNHLIRRMCATQGLDVRRLTRLKFANLSLEKLKQGEYRILSKEEEKRLYEPA